VPVFRLLPVDLGHPSWAASTHKDECQVRAPSEEAARALAHDRFRTAASNKPGEPVPVSPWKNLDLVRAEVMEETGQREDGPDQILVPMGYS
jgi:hypothetical protein